jgi:quercetin dioxygenase-like cupin family protein
MSVEKRRTIMGNRFASLLFAAWALTLPGMAQAQAHGGHIFTPREMTWVNAPPSLPAGVKVTILEGNPAEPGPFTMRLWVPADTKAAPHVHSGIEHATILSGTVHFGMGDKFDLEKLKPYPAGSFVVMPPQTPHFALFKEEAMLQLHGMGPWTITYVNPDDDPRKK